MADDPLSEPLAARFEVLGRLGQGAFGRVLLARDRELGRKVALKLLAERLGSEAAARFTAEARLTARLRHPGVVEVLDAGTDADGRPFLVYTLVEGESLAAHLAREGKASLAQAARWGRELADALGHAHDQGVVHRDVKPANVMLRPDGAAVLCDFGLGRDLGSVERLTRTGEVVGSLAYMAPEAAAGTEPGPAVDQYGLAATLYEAVFGARVAFAGTARDALEAKLRGAAPVLPSGLAARERAFGQPLLRALAPAPAARFPGIRELGAALEAAAAPPRVGAGAAVRPSAGRARALALAAAALVGAGWWAGGRPSADPAGRLPDRPPSELEAAAARLEEAAGPLLVPYGLNHLAELPRTFLQEATLARIRTHRGHYEDPRYPLRLRHFLDAMVDWAAAGGFEAATRDLKRLHGDGFERMTTMLPDQELAGIYVATRQPWRLVGDGLPIDPKSAADMAGIAKTWEQIRVQCEAEVAGVLDRLPEGRGLVGVLSVQVRAMLASAAHLRGDRGSLDRLVEAWVGVADPKLAFALWPGMGAVVEGLEDGLSLDCARSRRAVELVRSLVPEDPAVPVRVRLEPISIVLGHALRIAGRCGGADAARLEELADQMLGLLERWKAEPDFRLPDDLVELARGGNQYNMRDQAVHLSPERLARLVVLEKASKGP